MQKSTKNNRYKYNVGDKAYVCINGKSVELTVLKRLKRPYRLSDNFYYCSCIISGTEHKSIHYEKEMFPFDEFIKMKQSDDVSSVF
jgi:hypothetical protein